MFLQAGTIRWSVILGARDACRELLRRELTDRLSDDAAPAVEVIRLGKADQTVSVVERAAFGPERDVVDVMAFEEPVCVGAEVVYIEPHEDDLAPVCAGRLRQPGSLGSAGGAPGCPEVEDGWKALELRERHRSPTDVRPQPSRPRLRLG